MLWDPGSVERDEEEEQGRNAVPVTPILVPLLNKSSAVEKSVPVLVPDVQDLKDQFQQQQNMLTQIKETLIQNESQLSSKGKQMEVYANKLSQIRARTKNTQGRKSTPVLSPSSPKMQKKSSRENLTKLETPESEKSPSSYSKNRKGKVSELRKCLEENKIKFEERTGKEQSETKKIESLVEQLKTQLEERDKTIQDLQKTIEEPSPKSDSVPKQKPKLRDSSAVSKTTQTTGNQPNEDSIEVNAMRNKIRELEANVLDLEESLKEKDSVLEARTQAVTLLSQDLSLKGKNTLEKLEETRQEMRSMQNNFIVIEDQLKRDLLDKDNRLGILEEKCKKLESTNFELSLKNAEQQEKLVNLQTKYLEADAERTSLKQSSNQSQPEEKFEELTKKINALTKELDDRNKSMIKMKFEHKNKLKNLNKTLETLKETSDEKAEIVRLSSLLEEFENVKTRLENRVVELEDEKATEKKLKDQINELEIIIKKQNEDLALQLKTISGLEKENVDLRQANQEKNVLIENLEARSRPADEGDKLRESLEAMEAQYNKKIEDLKGEHRKEMEMLESYYTAKSDGLDRKALEEYRISTEINNIHVEEQIELLIREKQQLLEKLKSLSGVSSTDSLTFEKMEHSDLRDDPKDVFPLGEEVDVAPRQLNRDFHLEKIVNDQQYLINDLQKTIAEEKEKVQGYQDRISELEGTIKYLEDVNSTFKQQIEMSEPGESGKNTKTNTNTKNRIKKIEMELTQSKKTIQEQNEKLSELNEKLAEKEELIQKYREKVETLEKDDWDRQGVWKSAEDDMECLQELQKKCLSLENSLLELNEDCERLRKENIEIVHLLSEEKVKRKKLLEELEAQPETKDAELEEKINAMNGVLKQLEQKIEKLELGHGGCHEESEKSPSPRDAWEVAELQEKLEWTNVVLASKETEIFRLQNFLEDRNSAVEVLEMDLKDLRERLGERETKLKEVAEELRVKEAQLGEISANFEKLQKSVDVANEKTATNETQLKELLATVKEMEGDVFRKETELQEIKGILAEKNLDMSNLRNRLEEVNSDLTYSYQEHLENMGKCLRDKESDYDALLAEKTHLEQVNWSLVSEKEDIYNEKMEAYKERDKLVAALNEKEKLIAELKEKSGETEGGKDKKQEVEDLKIKLKKLAANLKKKAQNEADLSAKVKELEELAAEREKLVERLESEVKEVREKWSEKEKVAEELRVAHEARVNEIRELQAVETEGRGKIADLEAKLAKLLQPQQGPTYQELEKEKQTLLQTLAETTGKYEQTKFKHDQLLLEKSGTEKKFQEVQETIENLLSENSVLQMKIQENMAVIESLEAELKISNEQMKVVEEKFFYSEDRRLSLESKNEEMCRKIVENSENQITIDDLSVRIDELLKSEKFWQDRVKNLESSDAELKQSLDLVQREKFELEKELKASIEKAAEIGKELKEAKSSDSEKSQLIGELTKEVEKLRAENRQIATEFEKLNRDYEQFETDFKENLENWQNVEKNLRHKIEELLNENANLSEKCSLLLDDKREREEGAEDKKPKKRKSVTFRTDEVEYIKDLKNQLHRYDANLKQAQEEIETLKAELFRERLRHEVSHVVAEAEEKVESLRSTPEKKQPAVESLVERLQNIPLAESPEERKFDANAFFGSDSQDPFLAVKTAEQQSSEFDSLVWDDEWGAEGHLEAEYLTGKLIGDENEKRVKSLESRIKSLEVENERLEKELQEQTTKYAKALKKLKEVKAAHDKLLSETKKGSGLSDLDAAIVDELNSQIENMEAKEKELLKNLENSKLEKEALLKRIDVLNAGNEKFLEMKERQDNEVEIWQRKNNELLKEIADLRQKLENPLTPVGNDEDALVTENRELRNKVEALEWKNCELNELLEEKQELLEGWKDTDAEKSQLLKEIEELNSVKERLEKKLFDEEAKNTMAIGELNEQLTALATENETLQDILGDMKESADSAKKNRTQESKIFDYFKSSPADDLFSVPTLNQPLEQEISVLKVKINELEGLLEEKEEELKKSREACKEIEKIRQWLLEAQNVIKLRDEQLKQLHLEKENEVFCLREELEKLIRRDAENLQMKQSSEREMEKLKQRIQELEGKLKDQFETIDLNQPMRGSPEAEETLTQRVFELETLLSQREDELHHLHKTKTNEIENLRRRIFELEDAENEVDALRRKIHELEEYARLEENKFYQLESLKVNEIENLNQRIFELENLAKGGGDQGRVYDLENLLRFKEEESREKCLEIEALTQRVIAMEGLLPLKDEEIGRLTMRLTELEKSYNDSKLEIERLLNEEKLNVEEKFVEPFQENMKIPVAFEVEALSRTLDEEKQKSENLQYELSEKENLLSSKVLEIESLNSKLNEMGERLRELQEEEANRNAATEESFQVKYQLEKMVSDLQREVESLILQQSAARRELEECRYEKEKAVASLKSQVFELEKEWTETKERERIEMAQLRGELAEKTHCYEEMVKERRAEEERTLEVVRELEKTKRELESEVETLRTELERKQKDVESLETGLEEERKQMEGMKKALEVREGEVADLRETLAHLQEEIGHFRNFEKQIKELRVAQIRETGSEVPVTPEGHPDLSDWTEHELAELSTRLQSDLDTALYMLHQRDVRCDELTFELMQLLEERDTLQLRLSTALRMNEELRSANKQEATSSSSRGAQESKDLVDQSNDRQAERKGEAREDLRQLASKISELHSVSYLRDKTVKDDSVQRHKEQMNLLSRVSDSDITLSRDVQSSPAVLLNWMRGKTTPRVMHI